MPESRTALCGLTRKIIIIFNKYTCHILKIRLWFSFPLNLNNLSTYVSAICLPNKAQCLHLGDKSLAILDNIRLFLLTCQWLCLGTLWSKMRRHKNFVNKLTFRRNRKMSKWKGWCGIPPCKKRSEKDIEYAITWTKA